MVITKNNDNKNREQIGEVKKEGTQNKELQNLDENNELIEEDKDLEFNNTDNDKDKFNMEFFLLIGFVIMIGIDIYNTRIDYFNLPIKKIMNGGYTDDYGAGGIKGVRSEFFGPNITLSVQIRYISFIILFFLLVVSMSLPYSLLVVLIVICYMFGKKNLLKLINSFNTVNTDKKEK